MIAPWAQDELDDVDLGDARLERRARLLLSTLGQRPNLSIPAACRGRAELKAAYGFFDNPKVSFAKVLAPHLRRTRERIARQEVVLLVQDTTELDLTRPEQQVEGAGELDHTRRGVLLHLLHAFTPEGTPLGTAAAEVLNRTDGVGPAAAPKHRRPIEQKESLRWLSGLRAARELAQSAPGVACVCVADSEADIYELFAEPRGDPPLHWLIRACQDRAVAEADGRHLWDCALAAPVLYSVELTIRGRRAHTAAEDRPRRQSRTTRPVTAEVRATPLILRAPARAGRGRPAVAVNVVLVREADPPPGEPRVEWPSVTTLPIDAADQVRTVVAHYCVRWQIEVLFRTLKSGCRVERRRFEHLERLLPCLGLYLIVAWRTLFVCHLSRECPELDCEAVLEPSEWKAVWVAVTRGQPPERPPRLSEMVTLIARLGGYIARRGSEPGPQVLWIGMQRMYDLAWAWESFGPGARKESG